jgi:hypothetical protein
MSVENSTEGFVSKCFPKAYIFCLSFFVSLILKAIIKDLSVHWITSRSLVMDGGRRIKSNKGTSIRVIDREDP